MDIQRGSTPTLHWLDNYAKFYKASGMYDTKDLLPKVQWTAHGVKFLPGIVKLNWCPTADGTGTIPAMPLLDQLLADPCHLGVLTCLRQITVEQYDSSIVARRDVRRIPLKLDIKTALDAKEAAHLKASFDGLSHFYPVDIYPENIVAIISV